MVMPNAWQIIGGFFATAAVVLLIFVEISQISTGQKVPRSLRLVTLDTTNLAQGLQAAGGSSANLTGLFASGFRSGDGTGIRNFYEWGLWGFCEASGMNNDADYCASTTWGYGFRPADVVLADVPPAQQTQVSSVLPNTTFIASNYTGNFTTVAFYLIFVGAVLAGVAMLLSFMCSRFAHFLGAVTSFVAFLLTGVGATIWTIIIAKTRDGVNGVTVANNTPLGLYVDYGDALWVLWAAVLCLLLAVLPFFIACCTGRDTGYGGFRNGFGAGPADEKSGYAGSTYRSSYAGSQYHGSQVRY